MGFRNRGRIGVDESMYERWLQQFGVTGDEAYLREEWEFHPDNPKRKRRARNRPANRQVVKGDIH